MSDALHTVTENKLGTPFSEAVVPDYREDLESLLALFSAWYWEQDASFRYIRFSAAFEENTHINPDAYVGKRRWDIHRTNLSEEDWEQHKAQLERHEPFCDFEMCHLDHNRKERWMSVNGVPRLDSSGRFKGYRGIGRDITAGKHAENALRESEARFRDITELSSDWYWELDEQFRFKRLVGEAALDRAGFSTNDGIGHTRWELPYIASEEQWVEHKAILSAHQPFEDLELSCRDEQGQIRWSSISGRPIFDDEGKFKGYRGVGKDITEQREREVALLQFRAAIDATADGIHIVDCEAMRLIDVNKTACSYLGYTREEFLRLTIPEFAPGADVTKLKATYNRMFTGEDTNQSVEIVHRHKDGTHIPIEINRSCTIINGRRIVVNVVRDISERKIKEKALRESEARFRDLTELSSDWYWEMGPDLRLSNSDGKATLPSGDIGKLLWELPYEILHGSWQSHRADLEAHRAFYDLMLKRKTEDGGFRVVSLSGKPTFDENGVFTGYHGVGTDITERMKAQERIQYLATHDSLTNLPNRNMFGELLQRAIESGHRYDRGFALMFIDLDRFKNINDTFGHEVGDLLLKEMGQRLFEALRNIDVVARLGGDEFVVLVQEVDNETDITTIARKLLSALIKPMPLLGHEFRVTASIGIATYPKDAKDEQSLMKYADMAMYRAKEDGRNKCQFYSEHLTAHTLKRITLETTLRRALERDEFFLSYQAKQNLKTSGISGVEALLRWNHPELGIVLPAQFIPVAEENGLIVPIGKWVLRAACRQNVAWQASGLPHLSIAVNLSAEQFADMELVNDISEVLEETGMQPELLELELTETMVMQDPERSIHVLRTIKEMGVRLAIDDFGVGYSSLAQVRRFPIDTLKVDRSFIRKVPDVTEDNAITEAIVAMGKTFNLTVVAEGVEKENQKDFLRKLECDQIQGFYFSRPISADEFAKFVWTHAASESRWK